MPDAACNMDENIGDVLTTAEKSQQIYGIFEAEISCYGDEVDLHRHLKSCEKNPGHTKFIPPAEFTVDHLPNRYRDNDIVNLIQALSDLTVMINVTYTSTRRPTTYPNTDKQYPSSDCKGHRNKRTGSGWVWKVNIFSSYQNRNKHCPCLECRGSHNPVLQWAVIDIYTVTHLVYDEAEGEHTTCYFFYDKNETKIDSLTSVCRATRVHTKLDSDTCTLTYITHNISLANTLLSKYALYKSLHSAVGEKYNTNEENGQVKDTSENHKLTVIVSHPHGCSKQISVGEYTAREEMKNNDVYTQYRYTTATCSGCSGAPVWVLSRWWWWGCDHPHSGQCEDNKELNHSGIAMY